MDSKDFNAVRIYNGLSTISILSRQMSELGHSTGLLDDADVAMLDEIATFTLQMETKMFELMAVKYG